MATIGEKGKPPGSKPPKVSKNIQAQAPPQAAAQPQGTKDVAVMVIPPPDPYQGQGQSQGQDQGHHHHHHHHHKNRDDVPPNLDEFGENASPLNKLGDCYCLPNQICCFNRCCRLGSMVGAVGFFDAMIYMILSSVCTFLLLMWESTGKYVKSRGLINKYETWEKFMIPNEDGLYILLVAYVGSAIAGWNLGLRYRNMRRCPGVWWLLTNIYTTGLQIVAMIFFPFDYNYLNFIPILFRLYEYWIIWTWDRFLVAKWYQIDEGEESPLLAEELAEDAVKTSKAPPSPHHHHHHHHHHQSQSHSSSHESRNSHLV